MSTPLEALRLEAKVPSYTTTSSRLILRSREKTLRSAGDHPKRIAFDNEVQQRIQSRSSWRRKDNQLAEAMPDTLQHRQNINHFTIAPWKTDISVTCTIYNHVPGINTRNDDTATKTTCSLQQINSHRADLIIYTDGSATAGTTAGFAIVITQGPAEQPTTIDTIREQGRHFTSSFEEEHAATTRALHWAAANSRPGMTILLCTDSKSLCDAIQGRNIKVDNIRTLLQSISAKVIIQWIPGHSNIPGNELADAAAKEATTVPPTDALPISLSSAIKVISDIITDPEPTHERTRSVYEKHRASTNADQIDSRAEEVLLARLRAGHHQSLRPYLHRLDPNINPLCPSCHQEERTLLHWLVSCPALDHIPQQMFGCHHGRLGWLSTQPKAVVTYARKTFVNLDA